MLSVLGTHRDSRALPVDAPARTAWAATQQHPPSFSHAPPRVWRPHHALDALAPRLSGQD